MPWILCPFVAPSLGYLFVHIFFVLMIGSELERKLKKSGKYLLLYLGLPILGNLISKIILIPSSIALMTSKQYLK